MTKSDQRSRRITKEQKVRTRTKQVSATPDGEKLAKKDASKSPHPEKQNQGQQDISRLGDGNEWQFLVGSILAVLGLVIGSASLPWSSQPSLSLWLTVAAFLLIDYLAYWVLTRKLLRTRHAHAERACLIAGIVILLASLGGQAWISNRPAPAPEAKQLRGLLVPANEPSPPPPPICPEVPASATSLYFGDSLAYLDKWSGSEATVIKNGEEKLLAFERTSSGGILVNAVIRDERGKEVATVQRNVFHALGGNGYEAINPDVHSLLVLNDKNQVVLHVRHLNPHAIKILGIFHRPNSAPLIIDENGLTKVSGGKGKLSRACFGNFSNGLKID